MEGTSDAVWAFEIRFPIPGEDSRRACHLFLDGAGSPPVDRSATAVVVANALIWAAVLLGASFALEGTGCFSQVSTLLYGGAGASVVIVGGGVRRMATG